MNELKFDSALNYLNIQTSELPFVTIKHWSQGTYRKMFVMRCEFVGDLVYLRAVKFVSAEGEYHLLGQSHYF